MRKVSIGSPAVLYLWAHVQSGKTKLLQNMWTQSLI